MLPPSHLDAEKTVSGKTATTVVYRAGEWYYVSLDDVQYKANTPSLVEGYDYLSDVGALLQVLPDAVLARAEIATADGVTTAKVALTGEELDEIFADLNEGIAGELNAEAFEALRDGEVSITVRGGYVESYALSFGVQVSVSGVVREVTVSTSLQFTSPGADVTVNPPYGYENYPEYGFQ